MRVRLSRGSVAAVVWLSGIAAGASGQPVTVDPIRVQVGEAATRRGGLLDRTFVLASRDTERAERELSSAIGGRDWVRVTTDDAEAAIALRRVGRTQSNRTISKDRKKVSLSFVYTVYADIATRDDRAQLDARVTETRSYAMDASRQEPADYEDRAAYERAARELGSQARGWLLDRLARLRPGGPDAGLRHRIRHKFAVVPDGLEVVEVAAGSAAEQAGLRAGDRIRRVGTEGGTVDMDERVRTWRLLAPATAVAVEVERGGTRHALTIVLPAGASPARRPHRP